MKHTSDVLSKVRSDTDDPTTMACQLWVDSRSSHEAIPLSLPRQIKLIVAMRRIRRTDSIHISTAAN